MEKPSFRQAVLVVVVETVVSVAGNPKLRTDLTKLLEQSNTNAVLANIILVGLHRWFHQTHESPSSPSTQRHFMIARQIQPAHFQALNAEKKLHEDLGKPDLMGCFPENGSLKGAMFLPKRIRNSVFNYIFRFEKVRELHSEKFP
jgi:hypothetical protein